MIRWAKDLNKEQRDAITQPGSVFLVACPGSGKTRTLTYKIAYELERLTGPRQRIAAITYTNRAADEISDRVEALNVDAKQLWIGTIHSFCVEWILKPYGVYHDRLQAGFRIIDAHESEEIFKDICSSYKGITFWDCGYYFDTDGEIELSCTVQWKHDSILEILDEYFKRLRTSNAIDYELILLCAMQILDAQPKTALLLSRIFSLVLVDEYQDTRRIQYAILAAILKATGSETNAFIVGDPNQSIFGSLGGFAMDVGELEMLSNTKFAPLKLRRNYRSQERIIDFFQNFRVYPSEIQSSVSDEDAQTCVTYARATHADHLSSYIGRLITEAIEERNVPMQEVCVIAPQWIQLAPLTRQLTQDFPEYEFDGPGVAPFSRDIENFWYKVSRVALTSASPDLYVRRHRWAGEILVDLEAAGAQTQGMTAKKLLKLSNSIQVDELDGLAYLELFFKKFADALEMDVSRYLTLFEHREKFFDSSQQRIERIQKDNESFMVDVDAFRRVFRPKSGITISTIHGVKGAEFDTVIAFGLLDGWIPNFNDPDKEESASKMLYVVGSRARSHLHLISESGRDQGWNRGDRLPTPVLRRLAFTYDTLV